MLGTVGKEKAAGRVNSGFADPWGKTAVVPCSVCSSSASCWEFTPMELQFRGTREGRKGAETFFLDFSGKEMEPACMRFNKGLGLVCQG